MLFRNRREAGRKLAAKLMAYAHRTDVLVLALPRGGVPVAYEVAQGLHAPLDVFLVRKLGVPGYPELAMGALASGGVRVLNEDVVRNLGIDEEMINAVITQEQAELERRERAYRGDRPPLEVRDQIVILVDDGLAPAQACAPPLRVCANKARLESWLQCRSAQPRLAPSFNARPMRRFVPAPQTVLRRRPMVWRFFANDRCRGSWPFSQGGSGACCCLGNQSKEVNHDRNNHQG